MSEELMTMQDRFQKKRRRWGVPSPDHQPSYPQQPPAHCPPSTSGGIACTPSTSTPAADKPVVHTAEIGSRRMRVSGIGAVLEHLSKYFNFTWFLMTNLSHHKRVVEACIQQDSKQVWKAERRTIRQLLVLFYARLCVKDMMDGTQVRREFRASDFWGQMRMMWHGRVYQGTHEISSISSIAVSKLARSAPTRASINILIGSCLPRTGFGSQYT